MGKRWIWIVLDSVGIGAAPDAHLYGTADTQANTLKHVAQAVHGLNTPHLEQLGLGCIDTIPGLQCKPNTFGAYGKLREMSRGKDTTNGHWEFVGVVLSEELPVYPNGFPPEIIKPFENYIGKPVLCNLPASGTEVIEKFGFEHEKTGRPIVYTSADSVFQIATHEEIVPVSTLYEWCIYARQLLIGKHGVGRVIARPFKGKSGSYVRTYERKDFSLTFGRTVLNELEDAGIPVVGIGKIHDIYGGSGITKTVHTNGNVDGMNQLIRQMELTEMGLLYVNLVDFDALYGHRNDPHGFAKAIETFDCQLGTLLSLMTTEDVLCITADHGCDPTTQGTDHTREWVPLLLWHRGMNKSINFKERSTFADVGATVADFFVVKNPRTGTSLWPLIEEQYGSNFS